MKNYTQVTCAGNQFTDSQNFLSLSLIYPDNSIDPPRWYLVIIISLQNWQQKGFWRSCGRDYLFTYRRCFEQEIRGRARPPAVHYSSQILELLLAFHYGWEDETILPGTLRHFKRYQTCIVTFCTYYIAWILGDEGRGENGDCSRSLMRTVSTGCETPQCAASWMLLLYARDSSR